MATTSQEPRATQSHTGRGRLASASHFAPPYEGQRLLDLPPNPAFRQAAMEALGSLLRGGAAAPEEKARLKEENGAQINAKEGEAVGWWW